MNFPFPNGCPADLVEPMESLAKKLGVTAPEVYVPLLSVASYLLGDRVQVGRMLVTPHNTRFVYVGSGSPEYATVQNLLHLPFYRVSKSMVPMTEQQSVIYDQLVELYKGLYQMRESGASFYLTANSIAMLRSLAKQVYARIAVDGSPLRRALLLRQPLHALRLAVVVHALRECTVRHGCPPSLEIDSEDTQSALVMADYFLNVRLMANSVSPVFWARSTEATAAPQMARHTPSAGASGAAHCFDEVLGSARTVADTGAAGGGGGGSGNATAGAGLTEDMASGAPPAKRVHVVTAGSD